MINLYKPSELDDALNVRQKQIRLIAILGALVFIADTVIFVLKFQVPWGESTIWYQTADVIITAAYALWLIYYTGIPFRLCRSNILLLKSVIRGKPAAQTGIFMGMEEDPQDDRGIKYYNMLFYFGLDRKGRNVISRILLAEDRPLPEIEIGDEVRFEACAKVMRAYEVITPQKFSEKDVENVMNKLADKLGLITEEVDYSSLNDENDGQ